MVAPTTDRGQFFAALDKIVNRNFRRRRSFHFSELRQIFDGENAKLPQSLRVIPAKSWWGSYSGHLKTMGFRPTSVVVRSPIASRRAGSDRIWVSEEKTWA
jgi:hypothetical protein